jgi:regulator of replication initiation timing
MTDKEKKEKQVPFTPEELNNAVGAEQFEFQQTQMNYLLQRCGDLRVNLNRALEENEALKAELTRLTGAAKKPTPRKKK